MRIMNKRQTNMTLLLVVAVLLAATIPTGLSGSTRYPCNGTWNGTLGPTKGNVMGDEIDANSTVTGTFDGDTTQGNWIGKITTTYVMPGLNQKGQLAGDFKGSYVMTIDSSGTITGTVTIPLSGGFNGKVTATLQGKESQTGELSGTWTGTLTVTQVTQNGLPLPADIKMQGSGEFGGMEQRPASQTTAATSSANPTTTAMVSTTTEPSTTVQPSAQNVSYLPYALIAIVALVIVIIGVYAVKVRRSKKS